MTRYLIILPIIATFPLFFSLYFVYKMSQTTHAKAQKKLVAKFRRFLFLAAFFDGLLAIVFLYLIYKKYHG